MLGYLHPRLKTQIKSLKSNIRLCTVVCAMALKKYYGYRGIACLNYEVTFLLLLIISVSEKESVIFHGSCCPNAFCESAIY